jgi:hypothetical protein
MRGEVWHLQTSAPYLQLTDEGIDHPNRILFSDEVVHTFWQQYHLMPIFSHNESGHTRPVKNGLIGHGKHCARSKGF